MGLCNSESPTHFRIQQLQPVLFLWLTIFIFVPYPFANSIAFDYEYFLPNDTSIYYQGDASAANGAIELTNALDTDSFTRIGRASYADPVHLWDSKTGNLTDFLSIFSFNITPTNNSNTYLGDGLTFFLAPYNASIPTNRLGGLLGLFNSTDPSHTNSQIVAVEFDAKQDSWDPSSHHIGIDVNSIESVNYTELDDRLANGTEAIAFVFYDSTNKTLGVWLTLDGGKNFSELYYNIDLRNVLPEWVSVGFSAGLATSSTERHTIASWLFNSTLGNSSNSTSGPSPSNSAPGGSPSMITGHKTKSHRRISLAVGIPVSVILVVAFSCFITWKTRNHGTNVNAGGGANGEIEVGGNAAVQGANNQLGCVTHVHGNINYNGHPPMET